MEGFDFLNIEYIGFNMVSDKKFREELYVEGKYFCDMEQSELERKIIKRYKKVRKEKGLV